MPASTMWIFARNLATPLAILGLLWGCGSGSNSNTSASRHAATHRAVSAADAHSRNMVSAVADPKGDPVPLQVRFELRSRPQPAQPLDVDFEITPVSASVDRVTVSLHGEDGLDLVDGADFAPQDRPPEGVPIGHTVRVLPKREGIFTLSAQVTVDSAGQSTRETYSIPIIAGAGIPDLDKPVTGSGGGAASGSTGAKVTQPSPSAIAAAH